MKRRKKFFVPFVAFVAKMVWPQRTSALKAQLDSTS
jgi:preprotein translocase subunit SecE